MLISWSWLSQYLPLDMTPEQLTERLMMAGLNHEATTPVGDDLAINLEVTSNRPDCLGHLGVAREAAVLFDLPLTLPAAEPRLGNTPAASLAKVRIDCPQLCPRYTARVIRGVKVGSSPAWLAARLATIGIPAINNVVDVTNYVLMECGQPLHAFDLARLAGGEIIVREARRGEQFLAINHKTYELEAGMCVIADARRAVALGGVMGGADTEVDAKTVDLLIESAQFDPLSIRTTARRLNLHSDSSYRFERGLDPAGVDWASRRCCQLIMEIAGGELAAGMLDAGQPPAPRQAITLRLAQLKRILGIEVEAAEVRRILAALGNQVLREDQQWVEVVPPTWRGDLTREIDLVEEVARIHGYDKIPEDASVPMAPSHRGREHRVLAKVREVLVGAGYDEAMTLSAVDERWSEAFSPWTDVPALVSSTPVLRRADRLRRSLVPSLLGARQTNESLANERIELFEIAKAYLPSDVPGKLPTEELMFSLTSGGDFFSVKGVVEAVVAALNPAAKLSVCPASHALLDAERSCELRLAWGDEPDLLLGYLGEVSHSGLAQFELRGAATIAELKMGVLERSAVLVPQCERLSAYPAVSRDLNLVVADSVRWSQLAETVRQAAGDVAEAVEYREVYRDPERLGAGRKSLLFTLILRSRDATLTNEQADAVRARVVEACHAEHGAELRA
jgi:phenylalanyl-tRNA synthetase beta chain